MTLRAFAPFGIAFAAACTLEITGCFDLFHPTDDLRPAADDHDFCTWLPGTIRSRAKHACAWLGACETPTGRNAFGPCMFEALLAYDCAANPNHQPKGKAHALWDCLWRATTCGEVAACTVPKGPQKCQTAGEFSACGTAGNAVLNNFDVRFECDYDGGAEGGPYPDGHGENCALWGQTCASSGAIAACTGSRTAGLTCTQPGCYPTINELHWCAADGTDVGIDCASNGAQRCGQYSGDAGAPWLACSAESDAAPCIPAASATCVGGVATSCPSGRPETVDCAKILGSTGTCVEGPLQPPFDWRSACASTTPQCTNDSCSGNALSGCTRGVPFDVNCDEVGLGPCRTATTNGAAGHGACAPP